MLCPEHDRRHEAYPISEHTEAEAIACYTRWRSRIATLEGERLPPNLAAELVPRPLGEWREPRRPTRP